MPVARFWVMVSAHVPLITFVEPVNKTFPDCVRVKSTVVTFLAVPVTVTGLAAAESEEVSMVNTGSCVRRTPWSTPGGNGTLLVERPGIATALAMMVMEPYGWKTIGHGFAVWAHAASFLNEAV